MWDNVGTDNEKSDRLGFMSFPEGISNIRPLNDVPFTRWQHWIPQAKRSVTCIGKANGCPICELNAAASELDEQKPYSASKKHSIFVVDRSDGKVKVLEQGNNFFQDLKFLMQDEGPINTYDIQIRRVGMGFNDTTYRAKKTVNTPLTDEELAVTLPELSDFFAAPTREQMLRLMNGDDPKDVFGKQKEAEIE